MDKIKQYQDIIIQYLQEYAKIKPANQPDLDSYVIVDRENNHFQLLQLGWQDNRYVLRWSFISTSKMAKFGFSAISPSGMYWMS